MPFSVRLTDKSNIVLWRNIRTMVSKLVARPLAVNDIVVPDCCVFGDSATCCGNGPTKTWRPMTRIVMETPVVIAKPGDRASGSIAADFGDNGSVQLFTKKDREHDFRLLCPHDFQQPSVQPRLAGSVLQFAEIEVEDVVTHPVQRVEKVVMLEAVSIGTIAVIVFERGVQNQHVVSPPLFVASFPTRMETDTLNNEFVPARRAVHAFVAQHFRRNHEIGPEHCECS